MKNPIRRFTATALLTATSAIALAAGGAAPAQAAGAYTYGPKGSCWLYSTKTSKPFPAYREYYRGRYTRCVEV